MVQGVDSSWDSTDATDDVLNLTTYGQGTVFPAIWPVNRIFLRTDRNRTYINKGTLNTPVWKGVNIQIGHIDMYAAPLSELSAGWLLCNGAAVSRITYAELFAVIGTTYGIGNGSTTFNLPNMVTNNKFPRATTNDGNLGNTGGESTHSLIESENAQHSHKPKLFNIDTTSISPTGTHYRLENDGIPVFNNNLNSLNQLNVENSDLGLGTTTTSGSGTAHENKPPFIDLHFIIAV